MSMPQLKELIGGAVIVPQKTLLAKEQGTEKKRVQIYYDEGEGFSEVNSFFLAQPYNAAGEMIFELELPSTVKQIRIDPAMLPCITTIKEVVLNGEALPITEPKFVVVNGRSTIDKEQGVVTAAFATADPNIYIEAAKRIGKDVSEIIFIDDNINADITAKSAGMTVYGIYDESSADYVDEMKKACEKYIYDFSELLEI